MCGISTFALSGLTRTVGDDADIGMFSEVIVDRRWRYIGSSRGELPMLLRGECRINVVPRDDDAASSSTCCPSTDRRVGVERIFIGRGVRVCEMVAGPVAGVRREEPASTIRKDEADVTSGARGAASVAPGAEVTDWLENELRNGLKIQDDVSFEPKPIVGLEGRSFRSCESSALPDVDVDPSVFIEAMDEAGDVLILGVSIPAPSLPSLSLPFLSADAIASRSAPSGGSSV